jgi:hypothetical protein
MKKISIFLAVLALALLFSTCKKDNPTTIDECISNFMSDINSTDRSGVYKNLYSGSSKYAEAVTAAYWNALLPTSGITYTLSGQSTSGSTVTAMISSTYSFGSGVPISFGMNTDSSDNAVISSIAITCTGFGIIYN